MKKTKAFITGVTGQDGFYLSKFLLNKGYDVHGLSIRQTTQIKNEAAPGIKIHYGDITNAKTILQIIKEVQPEEVYHLAAQSNSRASFDEKETTFRINYLGTENILSAVYKFTPEIKFYFAATSEMFGNTNKSPQNEYTPFSPISPYADSKLSAFYAVKEYRKNGLFACSGILFNHESPRRKEIFVTRKITKGLSEIKLGLTDELYLGNLDVKRDWGYAEDYVRAMWLMLQQDQPDDYVIGTGENHSVRELVEIAGSCLGFEIKWKGVGIHEKGIDQKTGKTLIKINPEFYRPSEVYNLLADPTKARKKLGWYPNYNFNQLISLMVKSDMTELKQKK